MNLMVSHVVALNPVYAKSCKQTVQNVEDFTTLTRMEAASLLEEVSQAAINRFKPPKIRKVNAVQGADEEEEEEEPDALANTVSATAWPDVPTECYVSEGMTLAKGQLFILALSKPDKTSVPVSIAVGVLIGGPQVCLS